MGMDATLNDKSYGSGEKRFRYSTEWLRNRALAHGGKMKVH